MATQVCIDANILIKLVVPESDSELAAVLWQQGIQAEWEVVAPTLFWFEITAVLRKKVYRQLLTATEGEQALRLALDADVQIISAHSLHQRAWELATYFQRPTAYDTHYLALAEALRCDFWTADQRLFNAVKDELSWVRWLGALTANEV